MGAFRSQSPDNIGRNYPVRVTNIFSTDEKEEKEKKVVKREQVKSELWRTRRTCKSVEQLSVYSMLKPEHRRATSTSRSIEQLTAYGLKAWPGGMHTHL